MAASSRADAVHVAKPVNQQILNASREEFRTIRPSATGKSYDKVVVGAAAIRYPSGLSPPSPRILLLKRAANEAYFPNVFEIPSGKVGPADPSIKHALIREVHEETGLDVLKIIAELEPMAYTTVKTVGGDLISKSAIQLNYVVSVSNGDAKLSINEHSASTWVTEIELDGLDITNEMRLVVREALAWAARENFEEYIENCGKQINEIRAMR